MGLFSPGKRELIIVFQCLMGGYKEDGDRLVSVHTESKTRNNGFKLQQG